MRQERVVLWQSLLFIALVFSCVGLDWHEYVVSDASLFRPTDIAVGTNPTKAKEKLGWQAKHKLKAIVQMMIQAKQTELPEK